MIAALVMLLAPASARKPAPGDAVAESFLWYLHNMQRAVSDSATIQWVLHRRAEGSEGWDELHGAARQGAQHARWKAPHPGREALWIQDTGEPGVERVHVLPEPGLPVLEVDEDSTVLGGPFLAHGQPGLIARLARDAERLVADPDLPVRVDDLGGREVRGEAARCFSSTWPDGYADHPRSELCINLRTNLVARHAGPDWELEFSELRVDGAVDEARFAVTTLSGD